MQEKRDISLNSYFCPRCHMGSLCSHQQPEHRDYNKCPSCGYMELKSQTLERVTCKVLSKCECTCEFVCDNTIDSKKIKKDNK